MEQDGKQSGQTAPGCFFNYKRNIKSHFQPFDIKTREKKSKIEKIEDITTYIAVNRFEKLGI